MTNTKTVVKQNFNEDNLTDAVIDRVKGSKNARTREISEALIKHLHAFIKEVEPSEEEWKMGIDFLTNTGKMCSDTRQEFILLSDTLGVSMLVDAINHRVQGKATETTVFGPFYVEPETFDDGADISGELQGVPLFINGVVTNENDEPIAGAVVDVWHSDNEGFYDLQKLDKHPDYSGRGRFITGEDGSFKLWTKRPTAYPIPNDGPVGKMLEAQGRHPFRPEHVHFMISCDGYRTLVTHIFAEGDEYLDSDVVFGVKSSLITQYIEHDNSSDDRETPSGNWLELKQNFVLANV